MAILDSLRGGPVGRSALLDRLGSGEAVAPAEQEAVDQQAITDMGEFQKGLRRYGYNANITSRAFAAQMAEPYAPEWAGQQFQRAEEIARSQPAELAPEIDSFRKVNDLRSAVSYASGALGEGLGSVGTMVAAGLLTRGAAFRLSNAARNAAQYAGGAAAMLPQEGGETALALRQSPEAQAATTPAERAALTLGKGGINAALESIVPNLLLTNAITGQAGRIAAGARPGLANIARKAAAGVVGEGGTEAAQELTGQFAQNLAVPGTGYDPEQAMEAAVRGAITGGVLGGAGGTIQTVRSNIDAAAETAAQETTTGLNRAVEQLDQVIRNPEQFGVDLTNTTMGALAEASARARAAGEAAGPAAAAGMDAVSALRAQFDSAVAGKLTPENRQKYFELTQNFRLLQPPEFERLRDALATGDTTEINEAIGDVVGQFRERVPRETLTGLKNIAEWSKKFGAGVTRAARERKAAFKQYDEKDYQRFIQALGQLGHGDVMRDVIAADEKPGRLARQLMVLRDREENLNLKDNPKHQQLADGLRAVTGKELSDVIFDLQEWQRADPVARRQAKAEQEAYGGDSQIARIGERAENLLLDDELQAQAERDGVDISGAYNPDQPRYTTSVPEEQRGTLGAELQRAILRDQENNVLNEEDTRRTPFNSLGLVKRILAADILTREDGSLIANPDGTPKIDKSPRFTLPAVLRSDVLTAAQIGQLLGGKNSVSQGRGRGFKGTPMGISDETIAMRTTEDGGYRQDFNSVDIAAQAGTPQERGGARENFQGFVPEFDGTNRDLRIQGYRLLAAISSMHTNGIDIPRSEIDPALLEQWGLDPEGEDIHIDVEMDPNTLSNDTVVQLGRKQTTIGDLTGATRAARSLQSQLELLQTLGENPNGELQQLKEGTGKAAQTAQALSKGLYSFAVKQEQAAGRNLAKMDAVAKRNTINGYAPAFLQNLSERIGGSELAQQGRRNQQRLYNGLVNGDFQPQDVEDVLLALESPKEDLEAPTVIENPFTEEQALAWVDGLELEYTTTDNIIDTLITFRDNALRDYELQQEAFGQEPVAQEPTPDDVYQAARRSPEGAETTLRQRGIDRQVDATERAAREQAQREYDARVAGEERQAIAEDQAAIRQEQDREAAQTLREETAPPPLGAFQRRLVAGTEFVDDRTPLARTVRGWAEKYLDGAEVRVVEYDPENADVQEYFGANSFRGGKPPLGRALPANLFAPDTPAMILLQRGTSNRAGTRYGRMHTLAHEFGHIIDYTAFRNAPDAVKAGVDRAYQRLVEDLVNQGNVDEAMFNAGSVNRFIRDSARADVLTSDVPYEQNARLIMEGIAARRERGDADYILSKQEFFAEQFAKYVLNDPNIFAGADQEVRSYLDRILAKIKQFYRQVIQGLDKTAPEFDTFMKWLGTPAAERPAFPDYDPAVWDERNPPPEGTQTPRDEIRRAIFEKRLEDMSPEEKDVAIRELRQTVDVDQRTELGTYAKWRRTDKKRHIVSLDVDNLKAVNDTMGHPAGDQMLLMIGDALRSVGLEEDSFHISGDEFYVHSNNKTPLVQKLRQAQKYLETRTVTGQGYEFPNPTFSFGIGRTLEDAEVALQQNKTDREAAGERTARGEIPERMQRVEPPQEPPPPPQEPPPPPPPDDDARARFEATVKRLLGNRVRVQFGADNLPEGVAAEYVSTFGKDLESTGDALKEITEARRREIDALQRRRNATPEEIANGEVDARSVGQIEESIRSLEAQEQDYLNDLAVRGTIRVAAGLEAQAGLAEHESLHAAFAIFFGDNNAADRKAITTAFTRGVLARRLQNYFRDNEAVLAVIDPTSPDFRAEEAAAYGFQVFLHDPAALQMGQKVEGIYNRFLQFLQGLVGYKTYEERARIIFNDLNSGRRSERGTSVLRDRVGVEQSMLSRSQDFVREVGAGFMHMYDTVLSSSYSRLEGSGNVAMAQIARLGYNATGERGQGMIQLQRQATTRLSNRLKEALHTLDQEELNQLNRAMLLNEQLPGRLGDAQQRLRTLLADAHRYQTEAGVELGFVPDYYPMIWSPEKVAADYQGFIAMLNKYPEQLAELKKTPDELFQDIASFEERGHEFQGVFGKDGEPVADSSKRRSLGFITPEDRLAFMEDDLVTTMAHYLNQSVRHAEYVRAFGQQGTRLRQLIGEIRGVYGGTQHDVDLAKDYIDGLMGNKEVGMSRELKDLYGAATVYQNVRLLPLSVFSSLVDPLGVAVRTNSMSSAFETFTYSMRNLFTDFRRDWTPDQWEKYAEDMGIIDMSGTVKSIDKIYTGVTLRGKTRAINDGFFKWNLLNGWVKNNHIMATKAAQQFLRRSAEGMFGEQRSAENLQEVGLRPEDIVYDETLGRIRSTTPEILGITTEQLEAFEQDNPEAVAEARAQADRIQQAIHKIVRQALIQPSSAELPGWMSNPYLAPIAHLKTFVFGFNATILNRLEYEAQRGNYSPIYYAAAYVPGMIAADFLKGLAGNGGEEPDWKKNWTLSDYVTYGVHRSGLTGTGQFFVDMNNDVTRGGGGWESLSGPTIEQAHDLMRAMNAPTPEPTNTWMINALPVNDLYDQWLR